MKFSNRVGRADFLKKNFYSLLVFDLHKHEAMSQCEANNIINASILYPGLFSLCVGLIHVDIPVSVLRSPWKQSKVRYHSWQSPMFKCVNLTYSLVCMGPGPPPKKKP